MRAWTTLRALMGHWRRHPVECLTLLAGLAVATALWSGVQALNAEARASYRSRQAFREIADLAEERLALVLLRTRGFTVAVVVGTQRRGSIDAAEIARPQPIRDISEPLVGGPLQRGIVK